MGGVQGLDYTGVEAVFRILRVRDRAEMFDKFQDMERAVAKYWNEVSN